MPALPKTCLIRFLDCIMYPSDILYLMDTFPSGNARRSDDLPALQLLDLIASSPRMPLRDDDAVHLAGMRPFCFGRTDVRQAWSIGSGPLVVLVHGWGGIGAQMAPLAVQLATAGFRCVLFDALGHGQSADTKIGFNTFSDDSAALSSQLAEPVHAFIGHSAGALGMMAARYLHGLSARHYVCLAMPQFPYVPLETLKAKFGFTDDQLQALKPLLSDQFKRSWAELEAGCVFSDNPEGQLTLIYDVDDPRVRHRDADAIAELWPASHVVKTGGLGHNRILRSPEVISLIGSTLKDQAAEIGRDSKRTTANG
jgi:pimeloyl-ACP methyl ester carboxylesterase